MPQLSKFSVSNSKKSFDDIEVSYSKSSDYTSLKDLSQSKDDLQYKFYNQYKDIETKDLSEGLKSSSLIKKTFVFLSKKISNTIKSFSDSKFGIAFSKVWKVLNSNALSRSLVIICASLTIAGVFPVATPVVIGMAGVSLASVAVSAIVDSYKTRKLRKLAIESDLLVQNRGAFDKQKQLFIIDNRLEKILEKELSPLVNNNVQHRLHDTRGSSILNSMQTVLLDSMPDIADTVSSIASVSSGNVLDIIKIIKSGAFVLWDFASGGYSAKQRNDFIDLLKANINKELKDQKINYYDNLTELSNITKNQVIQTEAISRLMRDKDYFRYNDDGKVNAFRKHLENIKNESKNNAIQTKGNYLKDFISAHNPFYQQPNKVSEHTPLTKALEKEIKDIAQPLSAKHFVLEKSQSIDIIRDIHNRSINRKIGI